MLLFVLQTKMSSSEVDSKIDLLDSEDAVKKKIKKVPNRTLFRSDQTYFLIILGSICSRRNIGAY